METSTETPKNEEITITLNVRQLTKLCGENWHGDLGASALSQASDEFSMLCDVLSEAGNPTAAQVAQRAAARYDLISRIVANVNAQERGSDWPPMSAGSDASDEESSDAEGSAHG